MIKHNKLVRDKIPEIIEASGKRCEFSVLDDQAYLTMLDEKLNEELKEYQESRSLEELADLLEVMMAVAKVRGGSFAAVEKIRAEKAAARGGFEQRILLEAVYEE